MRKYLAAVAAGAVLIAGQAAASDSAVVNADDSGGAQPTAVSSFMANDGWLVLLAGGLFAGLLAYGFSRGGGGGAGGENGQPASP